MAFEPTLTLRPKPATSTIPHPRPVSPTALTTISEPYPGVGASMPWMRSNYVFKRNVPASEQLPPRETDPNVVLRCYLCGDLYTCDTRKRRDICRYHLSYLEPDPSHEAWAGYDSDILKDGHMNTQRNMFERPKGFVWMCCKKQGDHPGCESASQHVTQMEYEYDRYFSHFWKCKNDGVIDRHKTECAFCESVYDNYTAMEENEKMNGLRMDDKDAQADLYSRAWRNWDDARDGPKDTPYNRRMWPLAFSCICCGNRWHFRIGTMYIKVTGSDCDDDSWYDDDDEESAAVEIEKEKDNMHDEHGTPDKHEKHDKLDKLDEVDMDVDGTGGMFANDPTSSDHHEDASCLTVTDSGNEGSGRYSDDEEKENSLWSREDDAEEYDDGDDDVHSNAAKSTDDDFFGSSLVLAGQKRKFSDDDPGSPTLESHDTKRSKYHDARGRRMAICVGRHPPFEERKPMI